MKNSVKKEELREQQCGEYNTTVDGIQNALKSLPCELLEEVTSDSTFLDVSCDRCCAVFALTDHQIYHTSHLSPDSGDSLISTELYFCFTTQINTYAAQTYRRRGR